MSSKAQHGTGHAASRVEVELWVVIPAYNEAPAIGAVLAGLKQLPCNVVVVDDGSTDATAEKAAAGEVTVLRHTVNLGQGAALQTGITYCLQRTNASHICTFDADGQHAAESIELILRTLIEAGADIAIGSRTLGRTVNMPVAKRLVLKMAVWFTRRHCDLPVTDTHNGLRVMTRGAAGKIIIQQSGMAHASEILSQIRQRGLKFVEVPVTITYSDYSVAKGQSIFNALNILLDLLYARWNH